MRRLPIYILLDVSGSMRGEPLEAMRTGLQALVSSLRRDPYAMETACLSVISYAGKAKVLRPLTDLPDFSPPALPELKGGGADLSEALKLLCQRYDSEVKRNSADEKGDWLPLAVIISGGAPAADSRMEQSCRLLSDYQFAHILVCAAGHGENAGASYPFATQVQSLATMNSAGFAAFWDWASTAIGRQSRRAGAGFSDELPPPPPVIGEHLYWQAPKSSPVIPTGKPAEPAVAASRTAVRPAIQPHPGAVLNLEVCPGVSMKFSYIPPGEFMMGSPVTEEGRNDDEVAHHVRLTKGFYMGVYAVSQEKYFKITGGKPSKFEGYNLPVEWVNWKDAQAFCSRVSGLTGRRVRLPTEAEWEYSCRAGTTTPFSFGATIKTSQANYCGWHTYGEGSKGMYLERTILVSSFTPNAFGLYNMHGNVWEWCSDWYGEYDTSEGVDPTGPSTGTSRVLRGGSWCNYPWCCRSAFRVRLAPVSCDDVVGFRVAMDL